MPVLTLIVWGANVGCESSESETSILVSFVTLDTVALRTSKVPAFIGEGIDAIAIVDLC